jgi:hypothetical protein
MKQILFALAAILVLTLPAGHAQDAKGTLDAAATALGAANLRTVQFSGWGYDYVFGQSYAGSGAWPRFNLPGYTMTIDFAAPAMRDDRRRTQLEDPPLGGGFQPLFGEQRLIAVVNGAHAWDVVGENAVMPGFRNDRQTNVTGRLDQIWLTPHGFLKLAATSTATMRTDTIRGAKNTLVSITNPTYGRFEATFNDQHLIERIDRWFGHSVLGDTLMEATFSDYKDFGGVKFPTRILQREGGYPLLDLTVADVRVNVPVALDVPANIRNAPAPTSLVGPPEKIADGVWVFPTYAKSVAVEFRDHVVVFEAAETEAQSIEIIDGVKKVMPGKPIRYLINTHSHFDHLADLRGRRRDDRDAPGQHPVLSAALGESAHDEPGSPVEIGAHGHVRRRGRHAHDERRRPTTGHLSLPWQHAQSRDVDGLPAEGEDPARSRFLLHAGRALDIATERTREPETLPRVGRPIAAGCRAGGTRPRASDHARRGARHTQAIREPAEVAARVGVP